MKIVFDADFLKSVNDMPDNARLKLRSLLHHLESNPFHPLLHTKRLHGELSGFYSFRITRDWRVIFYFKDIETVQLVDVGHRKDIYRS